VVDRERAHLQPQELGAERRSQPQDVVRQDAQLLARRIGRTGDLGQSPTEDLLVDETEFEEMGPDLAPEEALGATSLLDLLAGDLSRVQKLSRKPVQSQGRFPR
jgi:hypothetical protein